MASLPEMDDRIRVVAIGGGTGLSVLLKGLNRSGYPLDITSIVTTFDDGGSSGLLRQEFGYPALGDLRESLIALASEKSDVAALARVLGFRFPADSALRGHSVGNLLLAGLLAISGDLTVAVEEASRLLQINGNVLPVSLEPGHLCAELNDGQVIFSESAIDLRGVAEPGICRVFLQHPVKANPAAMEAIVNADAIVLGPGDLFTSVLPNTLPEGMNEAMCQSTGKIIYVCSLTTKKGETDGFTATDFVNRVNEYLCRGYFSAEDRRMVNAVIVNRCCDHAESGQDANMLEVRPVDPDGTRLRETVEEVLIDRVAQSLQPPRHDAELLAAAVIGLVRSEVPQKIG